MSFKLWIQAAAILKLPNQLVNIRVFLVFFVHDFKGFVRLLFNLAVVSPAVDAGVHLTTVINCGFENFQIHRGFKIVADSLHMLGTILLGE